MPNTPSRQAVIKKNAEKKEKEKQLDAAMKILRLPQNDMNQQLLNGMYSSVVNAAKNNIQISDNEKRIAQDYGSLPNQSQSSFRPLYTTDEVDARQKLVSDYLSNRKIANNELALALQYAGEQTSGSSPGLIMGRMTISCTTCWKKCSP